MTLVSLPLFLIPIYLSYLRRDIVGLFMYTIAMSMVSNQILFVVKNRRFYLNSIYLSFITLYHVLLLVTKFYYIVSFFIIIFHIVLYYKIERSSFSITKNSYFLFYTSCILTATFIRFYNYK